MLARDALAASRGQDQLLPSVRSEETTKAEFPTAAVRKTPKTPKSWEKGKAANVPGENQLLCPQGSGTAACSSMGTVPAARLLAVLSGCWTSLLRTVLV